MSIGEIPHGEIPHGVSPEGVTKAEFSQVQGAKEIASEGPTVASVPKDMGTPEAADDKAKLDRLLTLMQKKSEVYNKNGQTWKIGVPTVAAVVTALICGLGALSLIGLVVIPILGTLFFMVKSARETKKMSAEIENITKELTSKGHAVVAENLESLVLAKEHRDHGYKAETKKKVDAWINDHVAHRYKEQKDEFNKLEEKEFNNLSKGEVNKLSNEEFKELKEKAFNRSYNKFLDHYTQIAKENAEREYNAKLDTFLKIGIKTVVSQTMASAAMAA